MSCWNKQELENMLEDVVNELDLSETVIEEHGPNGTPPAELVRLVLAEKDRKISLLQNGFVEVKAKNNKKLEMGATECRKHGICDIPEHLCNNRCEHLNPHHST